MCNHANTSNHLPHTHTHTHTQMNATVGLVLTAVAHPPLFLCPPQAKMMSQRKVMMKQKTETNITQPWGLSGVTCVEATRIHTKPPNTYHYTHKHDQENVLGITWFMWLAAWSIHMMYIHIRVR